VKWEEDWTGFDVVVMASGPSLTQDDVNAVEAWRNEQDDRRVIVTNTTYQIAPWADVVAFYDRKWWGKYKEAIKALPGLLFTSCNLNHPEVCEIKQHPLLVYGNSGAMAVALAIYSKAKRVILLGVDCKTSNGKRHWHGDHPQGLGNAKSVGKWGPHFSRASGYAKAHGVEVINCSRDTALTCFERRPLESAL
jgi:hypothetical protein